MKKERKKSIQNIIQPVPVGTATNKTDESNLIVTQAEKLYRINPNLEALINGTEDLIWSIDKNLRLITFNKAYQEQIKMLIGKEPKEGDPVISDDAGVELQKKWGAYYERALNGERFEVREKVFHLLRQSKLYSLITFNPMFNERGELFGAACYSKDITAETNYQMALEKTKAELQSIMDSSLDMICSIDANGIILGISAACITILGYTPDELIGRPLFDFLYPEDKEASERVAAMVMNGVDVYYFENRYVRKDGSLVPLFWTARWDSDKRIRYGVARDATEKKKQELQVHLSEQRFKSLVQDGSDLIGIIDSEANYIYISPTVEQILGYQVGELIKKNAFDFIHPDDRDVVRSSFYKINETKKIDLVPFRFISKQGEYRWIETTITNLIDEPTIQGIVANSRDITERILTHEKLLKSEQKYHDIFENNPSPMYIWDFATLQIIDCNEEALLKYGYTREEFLKLTIRDLRPAEDIPLIEEATQSEEFYLANLREVWRHKKKNGELIYMDIKGYFFDYNGRRSVLLMMVDVTAKLKAEEELRLSEAMLAEAQRLSKMGSWSFDFRTDHLTWSDELYVVFGTDKAHFLETHGSFIDFIDPEYRELVVATSKHTQQTGDAFNIIYSITTTKGEKRIIEEYGYGEKDKDGNIIRLFGTAQDVTERKLAEGRIMEANERFEYVTKATSDVIWDWNLETNEVYYSDNIQKLFGHKPGINNDNLPFYFEHVHPDDRERVVLYPDQVKYGTMINWEQEYRFRKADGDYAFIVDKGIVIRDATGLGKRMVGAMHDITDRKANEQKLLKSGQQLDLIYNNVKDVIFMLGVENEKKFKFISINQSFVESTGIEREQIINKYVEDVIPEPSLTTVLDKYSEAVRLKAKVTWEETTSYPTGKKTGIVTVTPIYDPEGICTQLIGSVYDITERKQEEQRMKLLQSVITHATDCVIITEAALIDEPGPRIVYVNNAFTQMTGYSADEVIGKSPRILQGPKTDKQELQRLKESIQKWEPCQITVINYKKNGEEFWINFAVSYLKGENGEYTHMIAIERDVTKAKNEELQRQLWSSISNIFNQNTGLKESFDNVLEELVAYGDFSIAEAWTISSDRNKINLISKFPPNSQMQIFYDKTDHFKSFDIGVGLPGATWETDIVQFWRDVDENKTFIRREAAKKAGLKTAFGIPIIFNHEMIGVLVVGLNRDVEKQNPFTSFFENYKTNFGTEIKRKQLEDELNQIFRYSPDVICTIGIDGYYKKINPALSKLLEYTEEELLALPVHSLMHADDRLKNEETVIKLKDSVTIYDYESRHITKAGKVKWVQWAARLTPGDGLILAIGKDITDKKDLEKLLVKATSLSRIGGWEFDLVKNTVYWSEIMREIHETAPGFEPDFKSGLNFYKDGESREYIERAVTEAIEEGKSWDAELQIVTAKGNIRWIRIVGEPELVNNRCVRIIGSFQDIDSQKKAEIRLKELNDNLQIQARELAMSNAELEQFAYVASHDLQEPLRMITSFMTQLERKYGDIVDDKGRQYIHFAVDGAKRMRQIILDLLEFSRVGNMEHDLEEVNFNQLLNEILLLYRRKIEELQAEINFEKLPVISTYKTPVRQIFQNLIGNSLKYHSNHARPEISISYKETKTNFQFAIKDNGIGIAPEYYDKIFIIFQRLHNKEEYSGTGMGLAIVKKIVENLGGKIWLESAEGKGSTFYFTLLKKVRS